ncbi:CHASE3 domain-containing protein [Oculatella sp. LEGE 06141]|uniref:CHASE3 domain-containing protein n=1 Tax=Oculatella sp. LEGE 06141 TaxID=1828648 RepID=UPI00187DE169|nr:CHASE3 domain-containing protein [Oculatella sp. LEGE 06141]MBE9182122.1 CHASE3 domain-containing protein [Oculatella sp. LEGE 06141]
MTCLVGALAAFSWSHVKATRALYRLQHTNRVKLETRTLLTGLVDAETGVRGYTLTGQADFLDPYTSAVPLISESFDRLNRLVMDDPVQQQRLQRIQMLVETTLTSLQSNLDSTDVASSSAVSAETRLQLLRAKAVMDQARSEIAVFLAEEEQLQLDRSQALQQRWTATWLLITALAITGVASSFLTIRLLRQLGKQLKENQAHLLKAQEIGNMGSWERDLETNTLRWSAQLNRIFGRPEALVQTYADFLAAVHPNDRDWVDKTIAAAIAGTVEHDLVYRIVLTDGSVRWVHEKAEVVGDAAGQPRCLVGTTQDVTERKQTEAALQQLNSELEDRVSQRTAQLQQLLEFEAALKRITDKVRDSLDEQQILQAAVQELACTLGAKSTTAALYDLEQQTATICYEYTTLAWAQQGEQFQIGCDPELYQPLLQGHCFQFCLLNPAPIQEPIATLACPMLDDQGILGDLQIIAHAHHIFSEQNIRLVQQIANQCAIAIRQARLYQAAQKQVIALESLHQMKDEFLNTVSHELRSPITNIKMALQVLTTAVHQLSPHPDNPASIEACARVDRYLTILGHESDREIHLINDLLDLQRLDAEMQPPTVELIDLNQWMPPLLLSFQERAKVRRQQIQAEWESPLPNIVSDPDSLKRILTELLNNACKYTPPDERIVVAIQVQSPVVQIQVTNFGTAIAASEFSRIFDKFYRIPKTDHWKQGGTGLGLALIKKLVEHLGGSIAITSQANWVTFTVEIPQKWTPLPC